MNQIIALIAAIEQEASVVRDDLTVRDETEQGSLVLYTGEYRGREVVLAVSGVGQKKARHATELIFERCQPGSVISFGCAGGLDPRAKVGDVVVADRLFFEENPERSYRTDNGLMAAATAGCKAARKRHFIGSFVTVKKAVHTARDKEAFHGRWNALAVEMESAAIARSAQRRKTPFLAIRTISDSARDSIPIDFDSVSRDGQVQPDMLRDLLKREPNLRAPLRRFAKKFNNSIDALKVVLPHVIDNL